MHCLLLSELNNFTGLTCSPKTIPLNEENPREKIKRIMQEKKMKRARFTEE
jgi:hypothetical protein